MGRLGSITSGRGRIAIIVGTVVVLIGALVLVTRDPADDALRTTEDSTTTTADEGDTTTTTEATSSTTGSTTSTTGPTTTATPSTAAAPVTTAAPPPPPPTTAAPPAPSGTLDMARVLAFAKGSSGGTPPQTHTGATTCPAFFDRPSDAGDDGNRDIADWYLGRYCDGTYRAVMTTTDAPPLEAAWLRIDSGAGGCEGVDSVVIAWHQPVNAGAVIGTPGCAPSSWSRTDAVGFPVFNEGWLQLDFRGSAIGDPGSFRWRGYVKAVGDDRIDAVPNGGPETFAR